MSSSGNVILWCSAPVLERNIRHYLREQAYEVIRCKSLEEVHTALGMDDYLLLITDAALQDSILDRLLKQNPGLLVLYIGENQALLPIFDRYHRLSPPFDLSGIGQLLRERKNPREYTSLPLGKYEILPQQNRIRCKNEEISIPKKEMELLLLLYAKRPETVSKDAIAHRLWPDSPQQRDNSINVYINNLRKYFPENTGIRFRSIYGKGIRLESE